jgi:tyrosinase
MRLRKNVKHLSPGEKAAYVNAVLTLKTKPSVMHPADPGFSRYDDYVELHMNAMMTSPLPGWAHRGPAFFPWHRVMLLQFENDLVGIDANVTIPYWDWTDAASDPFTADFLGGNGDATKQDKVTDGAFAYDAGHWNVVVTDNAGDPAFLRRQFGGVDPIHPETLPTTAMVAGALATTPYDTPSYNSLSSGFRHEVETHHNTVHRFVAGNMGDMTSPNDPVFFLHHANIDRLWMMWQQIQKQQNSGVAPYAPVSGAATGHNLNDLLIFSDGMMPAPFPGMYTPAGVIDNLALDYTYEEGAIVIPDKLVHLAAIARILWGIVNDAPGVWIGPDGRPHRVPGGPGDPVLAGLALGLSSGLGMSSPDVAKALRDADLRGRVGSIAERLMSQQIG